MGALVGRLNAAASRILVDHLCIGQECSRTTFCDRHSKFLWARGTNQGEAVPMARGPKMPTP